MQVQQPLRLGVLVYALAAASCGWPADSPAPMDLQQCVKYALDTSPRLEASRATTDAAGARVGQAEATRRPQVGVAAGYSDSEPSPAGQRRYSAVLTLGKLLYDSGRTGAQVTREERLYEASRHTLQQVELDVAFETARAYFGVLRANRLVEVAREQLDSANRHRDLAQASYEVGVVPRADVIRSEVEVARQRLVLVQAQTAVQVGVAALINAMGMVPGTELQIIDVTGLPPAPQELEAAIERALGMRPEVRQAEVQVEAAQAALRVARTGLSPQVNARAEWGFRDDSFFIGDSGWTVGVAATMPLSDGGDTRGRVAEAQGQLAATTATEREVQQKVALEVTEAALSLQEALESVEVAGEQARLARHNMELAQGRYGVGEGSFIEVTDARAALTEALNNETKALYDCHLARAALQRATGALPVGEVVSP